MSAGRAGSIVDRDPEAGGSLASHRRLMLAAGVAYLVWWFFVRLLLPDAYNPLGSRLLAVCFCFAAFGASYASRSVVSHIANWSSACLWVVTLHYFFLFYRNPSDINWVVGTYILLIAATAFLESTSSLVAYSIFVTLLSGFLVFTDPVLLRTIFLPGVITILGFAYVSLQGRLRLAVAQRAIERDRVLYEAARESVRVRDEFLSIASHELKTPLTNIKLQTEIAKRWIARGDAEPFRPENLGKFVDQMDRQADRLTKLVEEMLDVSRISAGKMRLERSAFDLAESVREVVASFGSSLRQSGCAIEVGGGPAPIRADRFRIEQVIVNLLSNAMKYGKGRPIRVEIHPVSTAVG